jgi:hypothetical protein
MPFFKVTLEDGRSFKVEADEMPTESDVLSALGEGSGAATDQGRISTFASGVARGALSPVPGIIGGVGALTGSETLRDTAESIEQGINETFPMNPAYEEEFWTGKAPQAIGQGISMLAMGGVGGAVGKGLAAGRGLSQAGQAAAATQAATRTMLSTGAAMGARGGQQEGEQYGLTGANLYGRIVAGALIEPFTEKLGGMGAETQALRRFLLGDAMAAGRMSSKRIIATEAGEEGVAQILGDTATNVGTVIEGTEGIGIGEMASRAGESTALGAVAGLPFAGANIIAGRMQPEEPFTFGGIHAREEGDIPIVDSGVIVATIPNGSPLTVDDVMAMTPEQRMEAANKLQIKIPRPSSVVAAELTAMAASGRPVPVDPQAIRPQDAGAVTAATQTNPETLAAVVAMTTNTTPQNEDGPEWISERGLERAAQARLAELERKGQDEDTTLRDAEGNVVEQGAIRKGFLTENEQAELNRLREMLSSEGLNLAGIASMYGRKIKSKREVQKDQQTAPVAPSTPAPAIDNVDEGFFQQPGKFYRVVVGDEAFEDIVTTGEVRTNATSKVEEGASLMERLAARPTAFPSFSKDSAAMLYARDNPNHYIIVSDDASIQPSQSGRHSKGKTHFPTDEQGNHLESLSGKKVRVYKPMGNGRYQLVYDQGRLVSQANPQAAPQPSPEVVAGVDELTDEEARAIDAELGINPDLGTGEFSERDAMRIIGQEPITPPTAVEQPSLGAGAATTPQGAIESPTAPMVGNQPQTQQPNDLDEAILDAKVESAVLRARRQKAKTTEERLQIEQEELQLANVQMRLYALKVGPELQSRQRAGEELSRSEKADLELYEFLVSQQSPTQPAQPQTQQTNEVQDLLQDQEQVGPQEADAQANAQTQEGLLAPTVAPSPEGAAISPQPPQPNVQNQIQEPGGAPAIQGVPTVSQPEVQTQAGTAQRGGQGQEVGNPVIDRRVSDGPRSSQVTQQLTPSGAEAVTEEDSGKSDRQIVDELEYRGVDGDNAIYFDPKLNRTINLPAVNTSLSEWAALVKTARWADSRLSGAIEKIRSQSGATEATPVQAAPSAAQAATATSPALQNAEQRAAVTAQETGNSPEVELQAIIETPQYGQEWLQEQVEQARAEGVQAGDTVVAQDEAGETIIGTVAATTGETTTVSTTSGDVTVPTAGLVRQAPQSLSRKPGLAQALMESDGAALQLGISQQDVERGIAATRRQIPGASNIWFGTRQAFLDTFGNDPAVQDMVQQLEEGVMTEGFYVPSLQRGFLFTDSVVVYQGDADRAALNGTTPAVEAAKRLIRHEVGGHGGWMTLTQKQQQQFMDIARDVIPVSDMNQMIDDGYPFQDWQTDEEIYRQAAEEWFSQRIGRMDKLPETGPMARFVDWLKGVWRWLTGRKGDPDLDAIKNLWRQIRMNQAAMATGRAWYSLPRQGSVQQLNYKQDAEYLAGVESGDIPADVPVYGPDSRAELTGKFGIPSTLNGPTSRVLIFWDEFNDKMGAVVVLPGRTAPVTPVGEREMNDRRYRALVESYEKGNPVLPEIQRMVNEAAMGAMKKPRWGFHGTNRKFTTFKSKVSWFSEQPDGAMAFVKGRSGTRGKGNGPQIYNAIVDLSRPLDFRSVRLDSEISLRELLKAGGMEKSEVESTILAIRARNAKTNKLDQFRTDESGSILGIKIEGEPTPSTMSAYKWMDNLAVVDELKARGFDGILWKEEFRYPGELKVLDTFASFDPAKIKSADPVTYDDQGNPVPLSQRFQSTSSDIRYSRVRSNAEIASAIRQQATLPNDPQTASEGKVIRDDMAAQFEPNERRSIQQAPPHELFSKNMGVDKGAAILDTLMQPERDPSKMAEMTPAEIEQRGGDVELNLIAHEEAVRRALVLGDAVSSSALARYGIPLPTGYRKFGELSAPVSPSLIRAVEFLTNQSLTEEAGIGMATTIYPYIAYRLMTDIANTITTAKSNVERVALSQAMSRIYEATSGINSMAGQRLGATGIAQRYFGVTAGGVMALVENTNKEIQGRIDASVSVDDLVAEINRLKAEIERLTAEESGDQINADTDVEVAEADMLKQEGIAESIIEEIANRLGDAPVTNDVERKEREQTIRDLHLRNVRQGMTERDFIREAATFEVFEGLASRLWNVGNLEREARATIKAAIDGIRRQEIAESRASRLIYSTEERLRQGSKDLDTNTSGDSINKAFRDQIKTPVSLTDFKERLSKLSVGGDVAERLFRTAEREMADLAEMDAIISKRREEKKKAAQVEIAESRASQLIYSVEERLRQGSKDLEQGSGKDTLNKAFRDQVKSPVSQEDFSKRLAALNVGQVVSDRLFKTAERERLDLEKAQEFTAQRRADTQQAREIERAEARASQLIYKTEEKLRQGSKDLDEGEGRDSINKAFRDQIESPVSLADFKARLASLKVGDTVADRLFKTAERERIDLAEAERFTAQRRLERKEQRQIEIAQERASQLIYGVEERLRQGSKDLTESPSRDTINKAFRDQVSKPVSFEQFQARLRNLRVNDRNIERMFNTAERERIDLGTQQMMRDRANLLESESPHLAAVIRRIKDRIAPGISWRDLMVVDAQDGQERIREIYRRVRKHEALRNLSPAEAVQLSNALNRHFLKAKEKVLRKELQRVGAIGTPIDPRVATLFEQIRQGKLTAAQAEAEIQAIVQQSRWKTLRKELPNFLQDLAYGRVTIDQFAEKLGRGRKASDRAMQHVIDSTPKLIQAMNLGAFNAQAFRDAVSEQFGLKVITSEQAREIQQMVINAQKLQPGLPRDKAVSAIIDRVADYTSMSGAEIFNSFWVSSVLSGGRTQFDTWLNQLNAMRRVLQLAAWTSAKRVNQGGVSIGWSAITRYFEVLPGMFQNALYYLWSGDSSLLLSEARETDRFLNNGQFSQSMDTKKAERLLSGAVSALGRGDIRQGIMAFPAFFIVGVRRLMQAADYFSAAATLEASIPLAIALNPELAGNTRIPSRKDYANFRKRAREILTGGREPASTKEKVEERILSQQLLMQSIDSLALRDEIMELGIEASYQNDPTGIGGIFYNSVLAVHQKIVASAEALRERGQAVQESNSPEMLKKADMAARNLMYALAVGARALTGLQFARFAGNKTNELLGMTPIIGLARLAEKDKTRSQRAMIIMDNVVGTAIAVGGIIYAMGLLEDDDDDERRGWRIEGGWDGLTADETRQLRAAGKQPYSIGYLDRQDGTWKNYSYLQWATSGAFATVGNLRDRKRYRPELWSEDNFVGATIAAAAGNGQALMNMSMLQNLNDIFGGNNAYTARDPVQGMATWLNRFASSYAGGFIPRAFKDADYMMDPRHTKANGGIELWLQHVPFYRRGIGEPYLDSLGYQVELRREPWSRAFVETQGTAAHNALSSLVGNGIFISSLNMDNRVVRRGEDVRPMTDAEQKRMMDFYFPALRRYLVTEGPRLERMPMDAAKDKISRDIQNLKSDAQDRAVR